MKFKRQDGTEFELNEVDSYIVYRKIRENGFIEDLRGEIEYYFEDEARPYNKIDPLDEKYSDILTEVGIDFYDGLWDYDSVSETYWDICRIFVSEAKRKIIERFDEERIIKRQNVI